MKIMKSNKNGMKQQMLKKALAVGKLFMRAQLKGFSEGDFRL